MPERSDGGCVLVYRDRLGARSEVQFLRRMYVGFDRLAPVWLGCHRDDAADTLGAPALILGRDGVRGALDRAAFKQFARLPSRPDLAALRPRLIHAHFGRGGALALPIARALDIPLVVTYHGGDATKATHYRRRLVPTIYQRRLPALLREAALFHCVSDHIREVLARRGFPAAKLRVIHYGVEAGVLAAPMAPMAPYLLFVGRLVEKKGVAHLIDALRLARADGVTAELIVIGDGPLADDLKRRAAPVGGVRFLGWLPFAEVARWMSGAAVLCTPSVTAVSGDEEGLPNVVLEAMSRGVPVIGSDHAGIGEAIANDENGVLVPPGMPRALADAIVRLMGDPNRRRALGAAARRTIAERFDAKTQSHLLEEALLSIA
ncbi:MAG TPA: glycosyltransferase [Stellaceae bacterium]|nr:glycosyltransferase [Stellaceae bacterium]